MAEVRKKSGRSLGERGPDWESFETSGPEIENEFVIKCPRLAGLFHWTMVVLGLTVVFGVGGAFFWFTLSGPRSLDLTRAESAEVGWGQFVFGGLLTVVWILKLVHLPGKARDR